MNTAVTYDALTPNINVSAYTSDNDHNNN